MKKTSSNWVKDTMAESKRIGARGSDFAKPNTGTAKHKALQDRIKKAKGYGEK